MLWLPAWDTACSSVQSSVTLIEALASCLKLDNQIVSVSKTALFNIYLAWKLCLSLLGKVPDKANSEFCWDLEQSQLLQLKLTAWSFEETISHYAPIQFCIYFFSRIIFKVIYCLSEWNEVESSCLSLNSYFYCLLMLPLCVYLAVMSARQVNLMEGTFSKGLHRHSELQKWCLLRESRGKQQNKPSVLAWAILAAMSNITCCH